MHDDDAAGTPVDEDTPYADDLQIVDEDVTEPNELDELEGEGCCDEG